MAEKYSQYSVPVPKAFERFVRKELLILPLPHNHLAPEDDPKPFWADTSELKKELDKFEVDDVIKKKYLNAFALMRELDICVNHPQSPHGKHFEELVRLKHNAEDLFRTINQLPEKQLCLKIIKKNLLGLCNQKIKYFSVEISWQEKK